MLRLAHKRYRLAKGKDKASRMDIDIIKTECNILFSRIKDTKSEIIALGKKRNDAKESYLDKYKLAKDLVKELVNYVRDYVVNTKPYVTELYDKKARKDIKKDTEKFFKAVRSYGGWS